MGAMGAIGAVALGGALGSLARHGVNSAVAQMLGRPVPYAEEPVHILYTDYSKAKGQSLWNAVNILAELIWR